jgi:hypothetical protein
MPIYITLKACPQAERESFAGEAPELLLNLLDRFFDM